MEIRAFLVKIDCLQKCLYSWNCKNYTFIKQQAIDAAVSRITDFGYKKDYADFLVREQFEYSSSHLINRFNEILGTLNALKKNELYGGIPKYELPPKGIQKLAFEISNT